MQKYLLLLFDGGWPIKFQLHNLGLNEVLSADQDPSPKECGDDKCGLQDCSAVEKEKKYINFFHFIEQRLLRVSLGSVCIQRSI